MSMNDGDDLRSMARATLLKASRDGRLQVQLLESGRAKGAAKGSCGETVVQQGVFGESVSSLPP